MRTKFPKLTKKKNPPPPRPLIDKVSQKKGVRQIQNLPICKRSTGNVVVSHSHFFRQKTPCYYSTDTIWPMSVTRAMERSMWDLGVVSWEILVRLVIAVKVICGYDGTFRYFPNVCNNSDEIEEIWSAGGSGACRMH